MRIPVGKILGALTWAHGVILGAYSAYAIKKTEEKPSLFNRIAQQTQVLLCAYIFGEVSARFWNDESLVINIPKKKKGLADRDELKFSKGCRKILEDYDNGEYTEREAYEKIVDLYLTMNDLGIIGIATFFAMMQHYPKVLAYIRKDEDIYSAMLNENSEDINDFYMAETKFIHFFNTTVNVSDQAEKDELGITKDQWFKSMALLGMRTDIDPIVATNLVNRLVNLAKKHPHVVEGTDFDDIEDLIKKIEEAAGEEDDLEIIPTILSCKKDSEFSAITSKDLKKYTDYEIRQSMLNCVQWFELGNITAETLVSYAHMVKYHCYEAYNSFREQYPFAEKTIIEVNEDLIRKGSIVEGTVEKFDIDAFNTDRHFRSITVSKFDKMTPDQLWSLLTKCTRKVLGREVKYNTLKLLLCTIREYRSDVYNKLQEDHPIELNDMEKLSKHPDIKLDPDTFDAKKDELLENVTEEQIRNTDEYELWDSIMSAYTKVKKGIINDTTFKKFIMKIQKANPEGYSSITNEHPIIIKYIEEFIDGIKIEKDVRDADDDKEYLMNLSAEDIAKMDTYDLHKILSVAYGLRIENEIISLGDLSDFVKKVKEANEEGYNELRERVYIVKIIEDYLESNFD